MKETDNLYLDKGQGCIERIAGALVQHVDEYRIGLPGCCPVNYTPLPTCWGATVEQQPLGSTCVVPVPPGAECSANSSRVGHTAELVPPQEALRESPNRGRQAHMHNSPPQGSASMPKPPKKL